MIRYAVTRRDRLAYRLASAALRVATPAYRRFVTLAWQRGVTVAIMGGRLVASGAL